MNNNQGRRRTRRVRQQRKQKNTQISRILLTICMMALVAVVSIGGTLAWLTAESKTVTNTFSTSNIGLTLTESIPNAVEVVGAADHSKDEQYTLTTIAGENDMTSQYKLIPGKVYKKDPTVTVTSDVPVYVFVKFEENGNPGDYFDYTSNLTETNEWHQDNTLPENVWYREVASNEETKTWKLLAAPADGTTVDGLTLTDGYVKVKTTLTADMMPQSEVNLKYTAYAIQMEGFATVVDAWNEVSN